MSIERLTAAFVFLFVSSAAIADHGSAGHINLNLNVPATSSTGNYTVTWNDIGSTTLWERVDGTGTWSAVQNEVGSKTFTGKAEGTYHYRVIQSFCFLGGCNDNYTWSQSIVVAPAIPPAITHFAVDPAPLELEGPSMVPIADSFSISWAGSATASNYVLEQRINWADGPGMPIGIWEEEYTGSDLGYTVFKGFPLRASLSYRVKACDVADACGEWSPELGVEIFLYQPPPVFVPPTDEEFASQEFEIYSADFNSDGREDFLLVGSYYTAILQWIPFGEPDPDVCPTCTIGTYFEFEPTQSEIDATPWVHGIFDAVQPDFDSDGLPDLFIRPLTPGHISIQYETIALRQWYDDANLRASGFIQAISAEELGLDLGESGITIEFSHENADAFADLIIRRNDIVSMVVMGTGVDGRLVLPYVETTPGSANEQLREEADVSVTSIVWTEFVGAINAQNAELAAAHFAPDVRTSYQQLFELLGSNLGQLDDDWSSPTPIERTENSVYYAIEQNENGVQRLHSIIFVRDPAEGWRIQDM